jgi:predicted amidophosphoribosyltransferase
MPIQSLLCVVLPRPCPLCGGEEGRFGAGLCAACSVQIGAQLRPSALPVGVDMAWSLGSYRGPLGELVRQAKFGADLGLMDAIGGWLAVAAAGRLSVDQVIPVSAPWWRTLRRGQDLPHRLARPVARALGVPMSAPLRQHAQASQVGLGRAGRLARAQRFSVRCAVAGRILLVDDVQTTGATLSACASELRAAGAGWVETLTAVEREFVDVKKS